MRIKNGIRVCFSRKKSTSVRAHTARVYLLQRGKERLCVCDAQRQGMRVHTNTQMHTDAHTHKCYKTLLRRCVHRWPYDPHTSNRETPGPLRLLFTSAYNAISFYSASLPLFPDPLRYRLRAYNVGGRRYVAGGKKLLAFSDVSSFRRYSSMHPWRILPRLRFSLTPRCFAFSITEPVTSEHFSYTRN